MEGTMNDRMQTIASTEEELRERAVASLKRKAAFRHMLFVYVVVNLVLIGIWALGGAGYFWPGWVIGGWGIAVAFQAWDVYGRRREITEDDISSEMNRLRGR
jgi:fatty acid desaturase